MKKYLGRFLFLASIVAVGYFVYQSDGGQAIESIKLEIKRYEGLNLWYFAVAGLFIMSSYLMGWITSKNSHL